MSNDSVATEELQGRKQEAQNTQKIIELLLACVPLEMVTHVAEAKQVDKEASDMETTEKTRLGTE